MDDADAVRVGEPFSVWVPSGWRQTTDAEQFAPILIRASCVPVTAYTDDVAVDQAS